MKTKGKKQKEMGLDDPLLGARLALPGVTRFVRLSALSHLSLGVALVSFSAFLLGIGFGQSVLLLVGALALGVSLVVTLVSGISAALLLPSHTLPGPRVGAQE